MRTRIDGTVDYRQTKQHLAHAFSVPAGATRLDIRFDYSPKQSQGQTVRNDLSLTLFDPDGARGARHNNADRNLTLKAYTATPGYVPGPIQPGIWTVWIDTHRVMPPDTIQYWFEIEISEEPLEIAPKQLSKGKTASRGPGWYRGDLHGHTFHSDGRWDVPDFAQYARDYKLDFVTLTDHNTVSPLAQLDSLAADDLLTMGGVELTTYFGHALALGTRRWFEWRAGLNDITMPAIAQQVMETGAQFVIAHPMSIGDPYCTGCDWGYPDMMPGNARRVEIWNSEWNGESHNDQAVSLWYSWLNQGYRMVATVGTDIHGPLTDPRPGFAIVYAADLTEPAIMDGIAHGHLYASSGPRVELTAHNEHGERAIMGDLLVGNQAEFTANWSGCADGDCLRVIVNGAAREELQIGESGQHTWTCTVPSDRWCTLEIRQPDAEMRAVTNPILMGKPGDWR